MPHKEPEDSRVVSVRLPNTLVQRLDRLLDWQTTHRRRPATRNAAMRDAQTPPRHPLRQCIIKLTGYSREISSLGSPPLLPYARPMYYIV